ncbi:MAG TPA: SPFH domain-containing protein [Geobacteraceae bacterium]|nr:SPFH domain-containing protein [Geobacteraceae bacterium]
MAVNRMNAVFLEVIEWFDETGAELVHRIPSEGSAEIKFGSQLVVRESQRAVFFRDGRAADAFSPGRHTLSSNNLPILTKILSLPWDFTSPFRCEVCFVSMKTFTDMRWGTREPVAFRDAEFGMVRLRAFGAYTFRVTDPLALINTLAGTQCVYTLLQIEEFLRDVTVSRLNDLLGETLKTLLDLPRQYDELALAVKGRLTADFGKYGLELADFYINSITPPPEVQRVIDEKGSMNALGGDLDGYLRFKAAQSMEKAAASGGDGGAAQGMGIGVGAGLGMMIPGMVMGSGVKTQDGPAVASLECPSCRGRIPGGSAFCPVCGARLAAVGRCPGCNGEIPAGAVFCPSCGVRLASARKCPKCGKEESAAARFCSSCGASLGE